MRVIFDILRDGLTSINTAASQMDEARLQVSSGRRVLKASDDPLSTQQAIGEHATLGRIDAYRRSADSASARLAATDAVLTSIVDKLTAAIVAGTSARGSEASPDARAAIVQQINGLRDSLVADFNTQFDGSSLFAGTRTDAAAFASIAGVWTYQGDSAAAQIQVDHGRLVAVTFDGQAIAQGSDADNIFTVLDALATAVQAGDGDAIGTAITALERGFDRAVQAQGRLGADERSLDDAAIRLGALRTASETRRSKHEDVNMAEAITRMTQAETAYRAALGAVSSAERLSLLDYLR
jgi:flagellar hook-associated protein 3 FlgL